MKSQNGVLYREWKTDSPETVLLLVHGLGGHSGRWRFLAGFFVKNNISLYAIELKGFGETQGLKGDAASLKVYCDDIRSLRGIIARENPGKKIFLLGESMGGLIVFLMAEETDRLFDGIICVSPALKSRIKFKPAKYLKILFNLIFNPKRQFRMNFDSSMCTRDTEYIKIMDSDPGEHRFATARLLAGLAWGQIRARALKDNIKTPLLFLLAGNDKLVDSKAAEKIFYSLKLKDKAIFFYPEMSHALSIDTGREEVFSDILNWIIPAVYRPTS